MAQASAFKQLYTDMINSGGNSAKCDSAATKKQIKCFVKESFPHFLVTDNHFYVPMYMTKKCVDGFKSGHSNVNISDLKSKVVVLTDWTLQMAKVNSADVFTSYGGIEIKLIVNSFKLAQNEKSKVLLSRYPVNLYRDDEMKNLINNYTHGCVVKAVNSGVKGESMPNLGQKGAGGAGVVSFASGNNFSSWNFKSGSVATVDMATIFKNEKGAAAFNKLGGESKAGGVRVKGGAKVKAPSAKKSAVKASSKAIMKTKTPGSGGKKSTAIGRTGMTPRMKTPGDGSSKAGTPGYSKSDFNKMKAFLLKQRKGKK